MKRNIIYQLSSGKNSKFSFFAKEAAALLIPPAFCRARREPLLRSIASRQDREEILSRASYCCKLDPGTAPLPAPGDGQEANSPKIQTIRDYHFPKKKHAYFFDLNHYLRFFPLYYRFSAIPGDVKRVPPFPAIVKSRPISGDNANSVLLNLNRVRHFLFIRHDIPFAAKDDTAIFRGKVFRKPKRTLLFEKWFGAPGLDLGETWQKELVKFDWVVPPATIREQLRHKFIFCIEGNEVASNLKWVLSSNSVAISPPLEYETWFLEGQLVPGRHFIEVAPDYSDLQEKLAWYRSHPHECQKIIEAAHAHVARFSDRHREKLVSLLVLSRYFSACGS